MARYAVEFEHTVVQTFEVEANNEDTAIAKAVMRMQAGETPDDEDCFDGRQTKVTELKHG